MTLKIKGHFFVSKKFSQQLIEKTITYFQKKYGVLFSEEQAEQCLDSLAELFLNFAET